MQSEYFAPIEVGEKDLETLARTRSEMLKLIQDPEKLRKLLESTAGQNQLSGLPMLPGLPLMAAMREQAQEQSQQQEQKGQGGTGDS